LMNLKFDSFIYHNHIIVRHTYIKKEQFSLDSCENLDLYKGDLRFRPLFGNAIVR